MTNRDTLFEFPYPRRNYFGPEDAVSGDYQAFGVAPMPINYQPETAEECIMPDSGDRGQSAVFFILRVPFDFLLVREEDQLLCVRTAA